MVHAKSPSQLAFRAVVTDKVFDGLWRQTFAQQYAQIFGESDGTANLARHDLYQMKWIPDDSLHLMEWAHRGALRPLLNPCFTAFVFFISRSAAVARTS